MPNEQRTPAASAADPVAIARALIRCPSITPQEGGALACLEELLSAHGFVCHRLRFGETGTAEVENLYARHGDEGPVLLFNGHTDVVPPGDMASWTHPPFAAEIDDGMIYGRGAVDMKGGIAAFVAAALSFLGAPDRPRGSIAIAITGDEEGPAVNGTRKLLDWAAERGERFDGAIVGEPTSRDALGDTMKVGRRGSLSGRIAVVGRQGHSAYPHLAANPVHGLVRLAGALVAEPLDEGSADFQSSNIEITSIDVGNPAFNVIPRQAEARFNIRFNDRHSVASLTTWLKETAARTITGPLTAEIAFEPNPAEVFLTRDARLVEIMGEAVEAVTGRRPEPSTTGGTSDARFVKDHCPVIEFGLVNQTIHQIDERVAIDDLEALAAVYGAFLRRYFAAA